MYLVEKSGDLFTSKLSKAHCVSADQRQGAGIALEFRRRYGHIDELLGQNKGVGEVAYFRNKYGEYIFTLITKEHYWEKPTYSSLCRSLHALSDLCKELGVRSLAIPRIGSGLDALSWNAVKKCIEGVWADSPMQIVVYTL